MMEPLKPEQVRYIKKELYDTIQAALSQLGDDGLVAVLADYNNFFAQLPQYFCIYQIWHNHVRQHQIGEEVAAMVCLKNRSICGVVKTEDCAESSPSGKECEDGTCIL